ncbi:MAG: hypothetical protein JXA71_07375 [Chitinispirillaceae bacterium]|nr:hypothetical protein [Chitinispirillaceae bacterium]
MRENNAKDGRYRLYDEHLVRNIMLTAVISAMEYIRENPHADSDEICDFIEANAENIIGDTVRQMKNIDDSTVKDGEDDADEDGREWLSNEKD